VRLLHVGAPREELGRQPTGYLGRCNQRVDALAALDRGVEQRARIAPEQYRQRRFGQRRPFGQVGERRFGGGGLGLVLVQVERRAGAAPEPLLAQRHRLLAGAQCALGQPDLRVERA
jgi:hypothetical protein